MPLSTLIVPVLLAFTACFAARKRVDVYTALTKGAEEGLAVLLHILPTLIALLSAVFMLRASGAMVVFGAPPALRKRSARFLPPRAMRSAFLPKPRRCCLSAPSPAAARWPSDRRSCAHMAWIPILAAWRRSCSARAKRHFTLLPSITARQESPKLATPFPPPFAPTQRCSSPRHFLCACSSARKKEDCRRAVLFPIPLPFAHGRAGRTRPSAHRC